MVFMGAWSSSPCDMQEGCHFSMVSQNVLLPMLANALQKEGMSDVEIAASDETSA